MYFSERDLSNQYISKSYQDVVQQYITTSSLEFILDGLGHCLFSIPSASLSQTVITSDITASMNVASSSYSLKSVISSVADFADIADTASICISSSNADTASYAKFAVTQSFTLFSITSSISSSWASSSISSSYAIFAQNIPAVLPTGSTQNITASWAINGGTQLLTGSTVPITASWSNNSISSNVTVTSSYAIFAQTFPAVIPTGSTQNITSSWSNNANSSNTSITSSYALFAQIIPAVLPTGSIQNITASWSISSSFLSGSQATSSLFGTASWATNVINGGTTLSTASTYPITSSWAISASWAPNNGVSNLITGSTVPITSSWSSNTIYNFSTIIAVSNTTTSLLQLTSSIYNSIFVNYSLTDKGNFRAGNVVVLYTTASVVMDETSTSDIGNSDGLILNADISTSFVRLFAVNSSANDYTIKFHYDTL